jgi:hypothetical protein
VLWQPEDDPSDRLVSLWRSTRRPGGGRPLPLAFGLRDLQDVLAAPAADGPPVRWPSPAVALDVAGRAATVRIASTRLSVPPWRTRSLGPVDPATFSAATVDERAEEGQGSPAAPDRGCAAGAGPRRRA